MEIIIQILSDHVTTVAYINQLGGPTQKLSDLMTTIRSTAQASGVILSAGHLAGRLNKNVDQLSRMNTPYQWKLHSNVFKALDKMWGPHTVDRFVAMHNTQLPRYDSFHWDPMTENVDALAKDWSKENNYTNPPFWLIPGVLDLISKQGASVTLIAPK